MSNRSAFFRRFKRTIAVVSGAATLVVVASLLPATAAFADGDEPVPYLGTPVDGALADEVAAPDDSTLPVSETPPPAPQLTPGVYPISLTPDYSIPSKLRTNAAAGGVAAQVAGAWQPVGDSTISVSAASTPTSVFSRTPSMWAAPPVAAVSAEIVDPATMSERGLSGLALKLTRTDGSATSASLAVAVPDAVLSGLYGADYASRVQWVESPADVPANETLKKATPVATLTDTEDGARILTPQLTSKSVFLTPMAAPVSTSGTGTFAATSLKPASSWQVSAQTGDFSWTLPLRTPPAAAGPAPSVSLNYDSQAIDGETGSTNNQPSAIGDGWSLAGGGFIERTYVSCAQDNGPTGAVTTSGDLCWKTDNATISLAGHSGQLVKDASSGVWKLQGDDGSRVEHLAGAAQGCASNVTYDSDCWRLTTTDGTQFFFGLNQLPGWSAGKPTTNSAWTVPVFGNDPGEPCHASTFAASSCQQGWRWNLDYVVDNHNNAEALYYSSEGNNYTKNGTTLASYARGGQLDHIDYGLTASTVYSANAASDKVVFGYDSLGRCSDASHATCTTEPLNTNAVAAAHPTSYPDVPFDQYCTSATCPGLLSPTFWTLGMLNTVTTKVLTSGNYANVDVWTLGHSFPAPGDLTTAALELTKVGHTGYSGSASITEPDTVFNIAAMQNRVWAKDGLAPLDKYRISSIATSTGAAISVNYSPQECTTANAAAIEANLQGNTARCFPQWWVPKVVSPQPAQLDLFHKYVVTSVITNPKTGGPNDATQETDYVYTGTPAWRYETSPLIQDTKRTWSVFAGYNTVEIRVGSSADPAAQQTTDYSFYQGMDGDRAAPEGGSKSVSVTGSPGVLDSLWLAGRTREAKVLNGVGGAVVSDTVTSPWASGVTSNDGTNTARMVNDAEVTVTQPLSTGGNRTTDTKNTFDPTSGLPLTVDAITPDAGTTCTTTSYASSNTSAWIIGLPKETSKVGVDCANVASASYPAAGISDTRISYDGLGLGAAPSHGDPTKSEIVDSYSGSTAGTAHWVTSAQNAYDSMGRVTSTTDILNHTTTTAYTPAAGAAAGSGALTAQKVTNTAPFNWVQSTVFNPAWGVETSATDENGKVTTAAYDALGRRTAVWLPGMPQATNTQPSIGYAYKVSNTAPLAVATTTMTSSLLKTDYVLYDGLGQQVQTQRDADGGGTVVTDIGYDSAGRINLENHDYWTTSVDPSTALFLPYSAQNIASSTVTNYDGASRTTSSVLNSFAVEKSRTSTTYPGADRTDTTPPAGGTPTSSYTNSLGQQTKLVQYLAATPSPSATQENTTYAYNAQGAMSSMTDPVGNQWTWGFDVLGHQIRSTDPDTGTSTSTYDDGGNLLTSTDARGTTLAYSYDAANRKTGQYLTSTGSTGSLLASWTFDTLAKNQLTSSSSYTGSTPGHPGLAYTKAVTGYDDGYRPLGSLVSIPTGAPAFGGTSYSTSMAYFADGSLVTASEQAMGGLPAETLRYTYTGTGHFSSLRGSSALLSGSIYTAIGQIAQYNRSGATADDSTYGYDEATGAIDEIIETTITGSTFTRVADRHYTHDAAGNVTSASTTGTVATDTQCYSYDYLRELTQAWTPSSNSCAAAPSGASLGGPAPYWTSYSIDPATGNRTGMVKNAVSGVSSAVSDSYSYPVAAGAHPHAVSSVSHAATGTGTTSSAYSYNQIGATTARPGQSLTYDAAGKVSTVTTGGVTQSNIYDASGTLLMQSDASSGSTLFLGDTELHVGAGGAASSATAVRTYSAGDGTPVAERTTSAGVAGSVLRWITTDIDKTSDLEVAVATGAVTRRYTDPYGNARGAVAPAAWSSSHGFLNAPTSVLSGLAQLGARAYDMTLGKFLSVDAVLAPNNPQQNNGYAYSSNTPITMSDPSGNCPLNAGMNGCAPRIPGVGSTLGPPMPPASAAPAAAGSSGGGGGSSSGGGIVSGGGGSATIYPIAISVGSGWAAKFSQAAAAAAARAAAAKAAAAVARAAQLAGEAAASASETVAGATAIRAVPGVGEFFLVLSLSGDSTGGGDHPVEQNPAAPSNEAAGSAAGQTASPPPEDCGLLGCPFKNFEGNSSGPSGPLLPKTVEGPNGETLPGVPEGAIGTPANAGDGFIYQLPKGTNGVDPKVTSIRVMEPKLDGKYPYPNGYVSYMNKMEQTVNPLTGRTTVGNSDPWGHLPLK